MKNAEQFEKLVSIVKQLRSDNGCPWDKEQTHQSLLPYFLEEVYEVIDSIDKNDSTVLSEELGDVLLHIIFQTEIADEEGEFQLTQVLNQIINKLVRRHPHVFGDERGKKTFHAKQNREAAKQKEKKRTSRLDGIPVTLPALIKAQRVQEKASNVGFDWNDKNKVWDKIYEEIQELKDAESKGKQDQIEEEMGDLFFALVNLCRFLHISSEDSLRKGINKFINRFKNVEKEIRRRGKKLEDTDLLEMNEIWERQKQLL